MKNKKTIIGIIIALIAIFGLLIAYNFFKGMAYRTQELKNPRTQGTKYWTCGMHPSVRVTDEEYRRGKKTCPICNMNLIPAAESEAAKPAPESQAEQAVTQHAYYGCGVKEEGHCPHCDEGKPDAKCVCGGHSVVVEETQMNCPACGKPLKKLEPEEVERVNKAVVSRVKLNKDMIERSGIVVEPVKKYRLAKTIRTVGKIAFDPELAIAEEEFLTALETREKVSKSPDVDVMNRAQDIVNKSKLRLRLLGLSDEQIGQLEESRTIQRSLILPEDKAWIYAEIYEADIGWIKEGQAANVTAVAFPGEEFKGVIKSINPVLDPATRSVKVRIEVDNPDKKLRPEMYVDVIIDSAYTAPDGSIEIVAVPKEALLDTGTRKIVYVEAAKEGEYLGKEVRVGPEAVANVEGKESRLYPLLSGLEEGELIVRKGNFLIDSQSQLTGGMSVLWGGAQEIKGETAEPTGEVAPVQTEHRH